MSGAVDNELQRNESEGFSAHLEKCGKCRDEYELERLTKAYVRRKIRLVDVPPELRDAILNQLSAEQRAALNGGFFSRLLSNSFFQPVLAVAIVAVIAVALFFANRPNLILPASAESNSGLSGTSEQNVLLVAMNNFQDVLSGKFRPQITAITAADVSSFLDHNAGYSVPLPAVPSADWIGGSVTNSDGSKITHVVYKIGEGYIYIYTFPKKAMTSKYVSLPSNCATAIQKDEWYWGFDQNGDTQAVWRSDDHVCVVTANLGRKDLAAYLKTSNKVVQ